VIDDLSRCEFETARLRVGAWHDVAGRAGIDLAAAVADILTVKTTEGLPEVWQGDFSAERAAAWIAERDGESPTLIAVDRQSGGVVGLMIMFAVPLAGSKVDLRIGYVLGESFWGKGLATELVRGLVGWAREDGLVETLTGGVATANQASAQVLVKNGFAKIEGPGDDEDVYQLDVSSSEWDEHAAGWDSEEGARAYSAAALVSLQDVLAGHNISLAGASAVDFGCGTGLLTEKLVARGAAVFAVDTSTAMLDVLNAKIRQAGWAQVETSTVLPDRLAGHDLIVCSSVCSFLDDYPGTAQQLVALLKPGGLFAQWDWERDDSNADPHGLSREEIFEALHGAGLVDIWVGVGFEAAIGETTMRPLMGHGRVPGSISEGPG
jgi:ribosomal-protein-alanine N-acetyltransferase